MTNPFKKAAILAPGLLGASLLLAIRKHRAAASTAIWGRREEPVRQCSERGWADLASTDLPTVVAGADLVILCSPIGVMPDLSHAILPHLHPDTIVTDVGSVKGPVEQQLAPIFQGKARWIGSHPMAGSEQSGLEAARDDLFEGARVVVTPTADTASGTTPRILDFWQALGARTLELDPGTHDLLVARISHLPHLLAALLVHNSSGDSPPSALDLAGGGFRDTTRIAQGPPAMWREILLENKNALLSTLDSFIEKCSEARDLIASGNEPQLEDVLAQARDLRKNIRFPK